VIIVDSSLVEHTRRIELSDSVDVSSYHTSKAIIDELQTLARTCSGMELGETVGTNVTMGWVKLSPQTVPGSRSSILLFFGEHARELISAELSLFLIRLLCANDEVQGDVARQIQYLRETSTFLIFPNINRGGRELVEQGKYCLRTNPRGVDLNRNWDDHWESGSKADQTSGGQYAFSEEETQILRDAATAFKPTQFYTIHSGSLSMLAPYAYIPEFPIHMELVEKVLETLAPRYCDCPYGSAAKELGYLCPGTCLDWIYDKLNVKFSYAFEIYDSARTLTKKNYGDFSVTSILEKVKKPKINKKLQYVLEQELDQIHLLKRPKKGTAEIACFTEFNPPDRQAYLDTLENWSRACLSSFSSVFKIQQTSE